jgi:hypothetical protein
MVAIVATSNTMQNFSSASIILYVCIFPPTVFCYLALLLGDYIIGAYNVISQFLVFTFSLIYQYVHFCYIVYVFGHTTVHCGTGRAVAHILY